MKKMFAVISLCLSVMLLAFAGKDKYGIPVPNGWPKPVYDFSADPLNPAKVELGRRLFSEPLLSGDTTISCTSCHLQYTAFTHIDHSLSHGIKGRIGTRNSPALMNLAWRRNYMWDGAAPHLAMQARLPISNPLEMDCSPAIAAGRLPLRHGYKGMFAAAFGDSAITGDRITAALGQFMLTLISSSSKYDKVMQHADTFTTREAHGYRLFRMHCAACHKEPLFTNDEFENNGLPVDTTLNDLGRMALTMNPSDSLKFKVPTLRNVEITYPYMHDGRFRNLQMVLFHYSEDVHSSPTLSEKLPGKLSLTEQEKNDIILFLKTLTDEDFLRNKNFQYNYNNQ